MEHLLSIWPGFGKGHQTFPRNLTWTKKGPGRRHSKLSKRLIDAINKARADGAVINPNDIVKA